MKNFQIWLIALIAIFTSVPGSEAVMKKKVLVQGHRGARGVLPENTMEAFSYALQVGSDFIELDVGVTKDDVVVVSHDPVLNNEICLDPKGNRIRSNILIRETLFAELQKYDCGTLKNARFPKQKPVPGAKIPSLEEVFAWINSLEAPAAKRVQFNIETKSVPSHPELTPSPKKFAKLLYSLIKKYNLENRVIVQSFDHRTLVEMRKLSKKIRMSALFGGNLLSYSKIAKGLGAVYVSPNLHWVTKPIVEDIHKAGLKVSPWTANTVEDWTRLVSIGVDSIITDYPKDLIEFLKSNGLRD